MTQAFRLCSFIFFLFWFYANDEENLNRKWICRIWGHVSLPLSLFFSFFCFSSTMSSSSHGLATDYFTFFSSFIPSHLCDLVVHNFNWASNFRKIIQVALIRENNVFFKNSWSYLEFSYDLYRNNWRWLIRPNPIISTKFGYKICWDLI